MELQYLFRKPNFPILGSIEGYFIGAKNPKVLHSRLAEIPINKGGYYSLVDCTGEVWSFIADQRILSPLSFKKRQTKLEIIRLFNDRKNIEVGDEKQYSEKSLSSKRFERVFSDLLALSSYSVRKIPDSAPKPADSGDSTINMVETNK